MHLGGIGGGDELIKRHYTKCHFKISLKTNKNKKEAYVLLLIFKCMCLWLHVDATCVWVSTEASEGIWIP